MQNLKKVINKKELFTFTILSLIFVLMMTLCPTFAVEGAGTVKEILDKMIKIIGMVFVAAGILLAAYSVGQLAMALKNEDADSKTRASTQLVVSIVLIALPSIIDGLDLLSYITE